MKREIKFRSWDGERMLGDDRIGVANGSALVLDTGKAKDWPLMQYTGLKDKNGVEIYEGDIVRSIERSEKLYVICGIDAGLVVMDAGEYQCMLRGGYWLYDAVADMQTASWLCTACEVIGNIHQHPELLK